MKRDKKYLKKCKKCNGGEIKSFHYWSNGLFRDVNTNSCPECEGLGIEIPKTESIPSRIAYYRDELTGFVDIYGSKHIGWNYYREETNINGKNLHKFCPDPTMDELCNMYLEEKGDLVKKGVSVSTFIFCNGEGCMILKEGIVVNYTYNPYNDGEWMISNGAYHEAISLRWPRFFSHNNTSPKRDICQDQ